MNAIVRKAARYTKLLQCRSVGVNIPNTSLLRSSLWIRTSATKTSDTAKSSAHTSSAKDVAGRANSLKKTPLIVQCLGYGGAVPFIAGAFLSTVTGNAYPFARATQLYGSSILSFLGAVHWGVAMRSSVDGVSGTRDFVYSVTPSLVAWCAALMRPSEGLLLLTGSFGVAFLYDSFRFGKGSAVPAWYRRLRFPLSVAAMGGCAVALIAIRKELESKEGCTRGADAMILSTSTIEGGGERSTRNVAAHPRELEHKEED